MLNAPPTRSLRRSLRRCCWTLLALLGGDSLGQAEPRVLQPALPNPAALAPAGAEGISAEQIAAWILQLDDDRFELERVYEFRVATEQHPEISARLGADRVDELELGFYWLRPR